MGPETFVDRRRLTDDLKHLACSQQRDSVPRLEYVELVTEKAKLKAENERLRAALKVQRGYVVRLREGYGASVPVIALTQDSIDAIDAALKGGD